MTEPSSEAVRAVASMYNKPELVDLWDANGQLMSPKSAARKVAQKVVDLERQRWEQEVRERLEAEAKALRDLSDSVMKHDTGKASRLRDEAVALEKALVFLRGEAEPFAEIDADDLDRAREDPNVQGVQAAADKHMATLREEGRIDGEAEPVEGACTRCDDTGWLCAECEKPRSKCTCGLNGASENGCPDCQPDPDAAEGEGRR